MSFDQGLTPILSRHRLEVWGIFMGKSVKPRTPEQRRENLRVLYHDPIIIPHDPENSDESSLPDDSAPWPTLILIVGSIFALFCVWRFAPAQITALWKNLVQQLLR